MKPVSYNNKVALAILGALTCFQISCDRGDHPYRNFLDGKDAGAAMTPDGTTSGDLGREAPGVGAGGAVENKGNLAPSRETVTIPVSEWEEVKRSAVKYKAELDSYKLEADTQAKAEFVRGEASCMEKIGREREDVKNSVLSEAEKTIDEIRESLRRYQYPSALVNGECEALTKSGDRYLYTVRNACLNVVHKKVGNDGDIQGLIGAVSTESLKLGILRMDCEAGRAHITLLPKKCDKTVGSGAGAGVIEPSGETPSQVKGGQKSAVGK